MNNNNKNNRRKKKNNVSLESIKDFPSLPIKKSFQSTTSNVSLPTTSKVTLNEIYYNDNIIYKKAMNGYIYLKSLPCLEKECKMPVFY